jgi:hypothetical protein
MRRRQLLHVLVIVALLALPLLVDQPRSEQHVFTGTVRGWKAGESITVASEQTDPAGFTARLRNTRYEGPVDQIGTGSTVTIWYRIVGESHPVVDKVRVNVR